jgi:hypothetical protein
MEEDSISFDRMLLWLAAKGQGSWSQFRGAVEAFQTQEGELEPDVEDSSSVDAGSDLPVYQEVRFALQRLGHVEFYTAESENGWRVVPPTVAIRDGTAAEGLLCGARSPVLLDRLTATGDLALEISQVAGMPERIVVRSASHELLVARVRELGFLVQKEVPASLLSALPSVRDQSSWQVSNMPETPGWLVHRFSSYPEPQWKELPQAAHQARSGLFRFVMKHQRFYYLCWRGRTYSVPVQVGKYAVMRRRRGTLRYDSERRTLSVPVVFRPPLLMERALVLCSGLLPRFDVTTRRLEYSNIDDGVAQLTAQLLCQEIR